ncbi:MAG: hypothetical protein RIT24_679, partial [Planctomycetota bacterium]
ARRALSVVEGVGAAQSNARAFLAALRDEASAHLRALASPDGGSYVAKESHPWTELMTLSLSAEQDLDLQIPPEQALVGLLVQWQRRRNGR